METVDKHKERRREAIRLAIAGELERQAKGRASRIDIEALADAVETAIGNDRPFTEGTKPDDLNATNDD